MSTTPDPPENEEPREDADEPLAAEAEGTEDVPAEMQVDEAPEGEPAAEETEVDKRAARTTRPKRSRSRKAASDDAPAPAPRRERPAGPAVTVKAQAKYVRTSARKARLVCDHIRGKDVEEARAILAFTPRGAAEAWSKLLESAVANAEHNHELVGDELRIASVHADEGPTLKRFRPRAMGRATKIRKRTSHLSITLTPKA